jgi:hypothetical protein
MLRNWVGFTLAAPKTCLYRMCGLETSNVEGCPSRKSVFCLIRDTPGPFSVRLHCVNWCVCRLEQINNLEPAGIR